MNVKNEQILKYNRSNTIIGIGIILIVGGVTVISHHFPLLLVIVLFICGLSLAVHNKNKLKGYIITERRKLLANHKLDINLDEEPFVSTEYLEAVLPKPIRMTSVTFNHSAIASGYSQNGRYYQIDFLQYNGYVEGSKSKLKKFDLTAYVIVIDFDQFEFCNRELLYLNLHSDISKYQFQQSHKLVMRGPKGDKVMNSSMYIHNRLMAYNGFHDKYMKNVIQVIDFNPNLFKKPFCKAAIFDKSKLYYFVDDDIAVDLKLEFHYTKTDIDKLISTTENQLAVFKTYIEHLASVDDGKIKTSNILD